MTNQQYKILKYINSSPRTIEQIKTKFNLDDDELDSVMNDNDFWKYYYGRRDKITKEKVMCIDNAGKEYVESRKTNSFRFWIPIVIDSILSLAAIVISIIALLK